MQQAPTDRETPGAAEPRRGLIALGLLVSAALSAAGAAAAGPAAEARLVSRGDPLGSALSEPAAPRSDAALPQRHRADPRPIGRFQPLLPSRDPADALVDPASLGKKSD